MIYAPPYLIRRRAEGEVGRTLASSPTVTPIAHKAVNTGKQTTVHHYYYGAPQDQEGNTIQRTTASHLPSRAVTNRLSGHRLYTTISHAYGGSSCLSIGDQSTVINMA